MTRQAPAVPAEHLEQLASDGDPVVGRLVDAPEVERRSAERSMERLASSARDGAREAETFATHLLNGGYDGPATTMSWVP